MFIYGASGYGKVVSEIVESLGIVVDLFVDDNKLLNNVWRYKVVNEIPKEIKQGILAIGNNRDRKTLLQKTNNIEFLKLIHPKTIISDKVYIGNGTVIMPGVTINADCFIGRHVIVNTNASIDHDCKIDDFAHISPNVALSGGVQVGEGTHIGIGACVIPGIKIGKWVTIGAGSVIIRDVPDYTVVVGNPGRIIKNAFLE
jgi:acetyltransferase EpsM